MRHLLTSLLLVCYIYAGTCIYRDEIQRIKASNPDITHREAFSAAAKNVTPLSFSSHIVHTSYSLINQIRIYWLSFSPSVYASVGPFPTHPFRPHARSGPEEEPYAESGKSLRRINPNRNSEPTTYRYAAWATLILLAVLCRRELNACFSRTVSTQQQQPRPPPPQPPQRHPAWAFLHSDFTPHRGMI